MNRTQQFKLQKLDNTHINIIKNRISKGIVPYNGCLLDNMLRDTNKFRITKGIIYSRESFSTDIVMEFTQYPEHTLLTVTYNPSYFNSILIIFLCLILGISFVTCIMFSDTPKIFYLWIFAPMVWLIYGATQLASYLKNKDKPYAEMQELYTVIEDTVKDYIIPWYLYFRRYLPWNTLIFVIKMCTNCTLWWKKLNFVL